MSTETILKRLVQKKKKKHHLSELHDYVFYGEKLLPVKSDSFSFKNQHNENPLSFGQ